MWDTLSDSFSLKILKKLQIYRIKKQKTYFSAFFYWSKNFDFISNINSKSSNLSFDVW
jgi:hypothetical protein